MTLDEGVYVPIIGQLLPRKIPRNEYVLVESDPDSIWYQLSVSMTCQALKSGLRVAFHLFRTSPADFRRDLKVAGLDAGELEKEGQLLIIDWYSPGIGVKSAEKFTVDSLQISKIAMELAGGKVRAESAPYDLHIDENWSNVFEQNEEKAVLQFLQTRLIPHMGSQSTTIASISRGVHSEHVYKTLEGLVYGIVDVASREVGEELASFVRVRMMKGQQFDSKWHRLNYSGDFEVTL